MSIETRLRQLEGQPALRASQLLAQVQQLTSPQAIWAFLADLPAEDFHHVGVLLEAEARAAGVTAEAVAQFDLLKLSAAQFAEFDRLVLMGKQLQEAYVHVQNDPHFKE